MQHVVSATACRLSHGLEWDPVGSECGFLAADWPRDAFAGGLQERLQGKAPVVVRRVYSYCRAGLVTQVDLALVVDGRAKTPAQQGPAALHFSFYSFCLVLFSTLLICAVSSPLHTHCLTSMALVVPRRRLRVSHAKPVGSPISLSGHRVSQ